MPGVPFDDPAGTRANLGLTTPIADRVAALMRGSIAAFRESFNRQHAYGTYQACVSGTQVGSPVVLLAGETYGHVAVFWGGTGATFGTNADGHWYIAVYDPSGNLVSQTADQGTTAIGALGSARLALTTPITPAADGVYTAMVMVYVGTGGSPVAPSLKMANPVAATVVTGLVGHGVTANAGQTSGVAPSTLGATVVTGTLPYVALYT